MKLIKFDLPINGTKVKNLDELRDNLTDEVLTLARSSQLERWLRTRQLPEQAQAVADAVKREGTDKDLFLALCKVLEVDAHPDDVKAIFDAPPAPGRFIPGARYFELYEELKRNLESKEKSNNLVVEKIKEKVVNKFRDGKLLRNVFFDSGIFDIVSWNKLNLGGGCYVKNIFTRQGLYVIKGSLIMEVECSNSVVRIYSPVRGVVEEILVHIGLYLKVGDQLISVAELKP